MNHAWLHYYSISGFKQLWVLGRGSRNCCIHSTPVPGMPTHKILHIPIVPQCQVYQQTHANTQNLTHTRCTPVPGIPANTCQHTKSYTYLLYPSARYANKHMPIHKILQVPIITQSRVCLQTCPLQHNLTHTHPYRLTVRFPVLGYSTPVTEKCIFWFPPSKTHVLIVWLGMACSSFAVRSVWHWEIWLLQAE